MKTARLFVLCIAALVALASLVGGCTTPSVGPEEDGPPLESTVPVPYLVGQPTEAAQSEIMGLGLQASSTRAFSSEVAEGMVVTQTPAPGTEVPVGSTVTYVVSDGPELVTVPEVIGMYPSEAAEALEAAGLQAKEVDIHGPVDDDAGNAEIGQVYRQTPAAGERVPAGTVIEIRSWWEAS